MENPYKTLGVSATATQDEIRNAYRTLAKRFHPDLNPGNKKAEQKFKEINAANELVGSAEARAKFDRGEVEQAQGRAQQEEARRSYYYQTQQDGGRYSSRFDNGFSADDLFENLFRSERRQPEGPRRGEDHVYKMDVSFRDAILGAEREITLATGKKLRVKIPPGLESGQRLRFKEQGGSAGGTPGDAYVEVSVLPSEEFKRVGRNIETEAEIGIAEAILGGEIEVPTVDGSVKLKVPEGVSSGTKLRVKGKGVPALDAGSRGDEIVTLRIILPKVIDPELREAIQKWNRKKADAHA